ncbi:MAG: UDP-N-acetylmuramoyl-L-alanine--D-glutamate ligase, partial [Culturomica sp.]|nr:UDP-N-acetylmuramoyl-L-alanine--D-glutamate ligase [Culturomica sp.]
MAQKLVILGGGESGTGAAILGKKLGYDVFLSDKGMLGDTCREVLNREGICWEEGGHTEEKILAADLAVKSPGIPDSAPLVEALRKQGTAVISEIEWAGRHSDARMICITGSNGKTTTTLLLWHILHRVGRNAGLAGNVGNSLAAQVAAGLHEMYVVELSSFQLDGMYNFKADIAILTNITPDHLDRYGD